MLTAGAMTSMTTFWTRFLQEPDSIKTAGRKANQKPLTVTAGKQQVPLPGVVDMIAMAAKYPSVAADLKQAGLTAAQWEGYRQALFDADVTQQAGGGDVPANSALEKNIAFLKGHEKELAALKATGMWFPQAQQGGGGDDDLNP